MIRQAEEELLPGGEETELGAHDGDGAALVQSRHMEDHAGKKKFISFEKLIEHVSLSDIKIFTNQIESDHLKDNKRKVNIDPGYLTLAKLVLASTKDFTHRIYIGKGIYAEVTLFYQDKNYRGWPWTYPDYKSEISLSFFQKVRSAYHNKMSPRGV